MKICIARVDRMGDMILTLPVIKSLKILDKSTIIHVIVSEKNFKIAEHFNYIDKIFVVTQSYKSIFSITNKLRIERYDYFFNFSPNLLGFILGIISNSKNRSSLLFLSRYNRSYFRKIIKTFTASIFYKFIIVVDRFVAIKKEKDIHQTLMMFALLKKNRLNVNENIKIDYFFPIKYSLKTAKDICIVHLSSKWINKYYKEENFIELINLLQQKNILIYLTSDETSRHGFKKIFDKYSIVYNNEFSKKALNSNITIFDNLSFFKWSELINSSKYTITPECGCTHIASLCNNKLTVIYDPDNLPDAIMKEYAPWKINYNKLIFNDKELNNKIISFIE